MKPLLRVVSAGVLSALFLGPLASGWARADSEAAVVIMAHGGGTGWNKTGKRAVKEAGLPYPYRIFYGMGDNATEPRHLPLCISELGNRRPPTSIDLPRLV